MKMSQSQCFFFFEQNILQQNDRKRRNMFVGCKLRKDLKAPGERGKDKEKGTSISLGDREVERKSKQYWGHQL